MSPSRATPKTPWTALSCQYLGEYGIWGSKLQGLKFHGVRFACRLTGLGLRVQRLSSNASDAAIISPAITCTFGPGPLRLRTVFFFLALNPKLGDWVVSGCHLCRGMLGSPGGRRAAIEA